MVNTDAHQVRVLKAEHAAIDKAISDENSRPLPDGTLITELKRRKLRIKDQLVRLDQFAENR